MATLVLAVAVTEVEVASTAAAMALGDLYRV
jgi:hypothetical protein